MGVLNWASKLLLKHDGYSNSVPAGPEFHDNSECVLVEDRGADTTLFCFAGMAVLFAGMPTFEFRRILTAHGRDCNLVFFRDVHRLAYHVSPTGEPNGLEFYEQKVRELKESLGATYNIAIGGSSGGSAAFYFGTRCGLDRIVAFSPAFPAKVYSRLAMQLRTYFNLKKLFRDPAAYVEVVLVTWGALWATRQIRRVMGPKYVWQVMDTYRGAGEARPPATIFYGDACAPDAKQAEAMRQFSEVKTVALPCGRHNCAAYLKKHGELGEAILREVDEGRERRSGSTLRPIG